ncbi:hypothetical protein ACS0X5_04365 [Burkholderia gladioli]|uniref:hypothetical protein n=1 Tax=Burkholderia gladioli TaxID=28095 RepID=UPI001640508C|nr:hypothetical protein [Burkholderia gladioli]
MQDFENLARMVIDDDPQLDTVPLAADGVFQRASSTLEKLTCSVAAELSYLLDRHTKQVPNLLFLWGPCRVGSTALLNVFAESGLKAIYQPIKSLLRRTLDRGFESDDNEAGPGFSLDAPWTVIKETSGPYTAAECLFNPLDALLRSGFPSSNVQLVLLYREPADMLASWIRKWSSRVSISDLHAHFLLARLNEQRVRRTAEQAAIPVYRFTSTPGGGAVSAVRSLFEAIGLADRFNSANLGGWDGSDPLRGSFSSVVFPPEPKAFELPNLHDPVPGYGMGNRRLDGSPDFRLQEQVFVSHGLRELFSLTMEAMSGGCCAQNAGQ